MTGDLLLMGNNIFLIGFMGTGKSTVGKVLADTLRWEFVDTDAKIEATTGQSIPQLFADHGEQRFREIETEVLRSIAAGRHQVVSTGGGAVLKQENREAMLAGGYVVALEADEQTIIERVQGDTNRPLLAGDLEARVHKLLQERAGAYDFARLKIDTTGKTVEEIVQIILDHMQGKQGQITSQDG